MSEWKRYSDLLKRLLDQFEIRLRNGDLRRVTITLSPEADDQLKRSEKAAMALTEDGELWSCVRERVRRFGELSMRGAVDLHVGAGRDGTVIALDTMIHAIKIERARVMEYREEFGYLGVPEVERDSMEVLRVMELLDNGGKLPLTEAKIRAYCTSVGGLRKDEKRGKALIRLLSSHGAIVRVPNKRWNDPVEKWTLSSQYRSQPWFVRENLFTFPEK